MSRVALVTGSSRGLGAAIARRLGRDGMTVAVNDRLGGEEAEAVAAAIRAGGGSSRAFAADVTDAAAVERLVGEIGRLDVVVLNATGAQPEAPVAEVGWDDHLEQLAFFLRSPVLVGRAALAGMRERRHGRIVMIDSEVADRPPPGRSAYAASKSAQIGLMRAWARELAPDGITVNCVAPGFVPVERHAGVPAADLAAYVASVPVGRIGTPDDVAHAVGFLVSDEAGFVTGQRIVVDGGRGLT